MAIDYFDRKIDIIDINMNKKDTKKVAIICSSNGILKEGFAKFCTSNSRLAYFENFSIGDSTTLAGIYTILKNGIRDNFDICIIDYPLNDFIFLERGEVTNSYVYGLWYSILSLFKNSSCKPIFIVHRPKHIDTSNLNDLQNFLDYFKVPYIDLSSLILVSNETNIYIDNSHYKKDFQLKICRLIEYFIQKKILPFSVEKLGPIAPTFRLASDYSQNVESEIRETSLIKTFIWKLNNEKESLQINIPYETCYLEGVVYWDDEKVNSFFFKYEEHEVKLNARTKFKKLLRIQNLPELAGKSLIVSLQPFSKNFIKIDCHNHRIDPETKFTKNLDLVDFIFCDSNIADIGRNIGLSLNLSFAFDKFRDENDIRFKYSYFAKRKIKTINNPVNRVAYLGKCIEADEFNRDTLIFEIAKEFYSCKEYDRAIDALWAIPNINAQLFLESRQLLSQILLFVKKNINESFKVCQEVLKLADSNNIFWLHRHLYIIYKKRGEVLNALYHGKRAITLNQTNQQWKDDLNEYAKSFDLSKLI